MKKLLIGAMMASLFMVGSDANAFSLFGSKKKTTQTAKDTSRSTNNQGTDSSQETTKKTGLISRLTGKANKQKTENATIYSKQMGKFYEAPVATICILSGGLSSIFSEEQKNKLFVDNSGRNIPDINAKKNIQNAAKSFNDIYKYMRKILTNDALLSKTDANNIIEQLSTALTALIGTGEEQNKPSQFWKYFGNHIRYALIAMRNNFNMLLYPKEYWNVGALLFSSNDGTRGENGGKYSTIYHVGSLHYSDPIGAKVNENSPILALRNGLTKLVKNIMNAEIGEEEARQLKKKDRNSRLAQSSSRAQQNINELRDFVSEQDLRRQGKDVSIDDEDVRQPVGRKSKSLGNLISAQSAARRLKANSDTRTQDEYGSGEDTDESAHDDAWSKYAATNDDEYDDSEAWGQ